MIKFLLGDLLDLGNLVSSLLGMRSVKVSVVRQIQQKLEHRLGHVPGEGQGRLQHGFRVDGFNRLSNGGGMRRRLGGGDLGVRGVGRMGRPFLFGFRLVFRCGGGGGGSR